MVVSFCAPSSACQDQRWYGHKLESGMSKSYRRLAHHLLGYLVSWLHWQPHSVRLLDLLRCMAFHPELPLNLREWADERVCGFVDDYAPVAPWPRRLQWFYDHEILPLRTFRLRMLRHFPLEAIRATPPQLLIDLIGLQPPRMVSYFLVEIVCLADEFLADLPEAAQVGQRMYYTRLLALHHLRVRHLPNRYTAV